MRQNHDAFFKTLLRTFFADFVRLFFPRKAARIDFRFVTFLDKEVHTDLPRGPQRRLDLLAEVRTRAGKRERILVHVEIEAPPRQAPGERMFRYFETLDLRHRRPVFPIALVLARAGRGDGLVRREHDTMGLDEVVCTFRFWQVALGSLPGKRYVGRRNPLAPALAALMVPGTPRRREWKLRCLRAIARVRANDARRALLLDCVETYLPLTAREQASIDRAMRRPENKEIRQMRKLWSERFAEMAEMAKMVKRAKKAHKRGIKLGESRGIKLGESRGIKLGESRGIKLGESRGIKLGESRGIKLGESRGIKLGESRGIKLGESRGERRAKRETLLAQMRAKFGPLPRGVARKVAAVGNSRRLDALLRRVLTAASPEEMGLR
ncbi:MAG: hypothetical protein HYZ53_17980 [Planctomycetes bacterium]|nr:hypothetical protein [Planctomycetota bacterium]